MSTSKTSNDVSIPFYVRVNWKETPEAHVFKGDFPGMKKEEVEVAVTDDNFLQITGERYKEEEEENETWHMVERDSGKFMRNFRLPENADLDGVKGLLEDGVLTVTVPKKDVEKPEVNPVEGSDESISL